MIRYALACDKAHAFESWFPSSEAYEGQRARGLVTCPVCDSSAVEKQIMAPSIGRKDKAPPLPVPTEAPVAPQPVALLSPQEQAMRAMIKAFREHVTQNAENVGPRFVEQARKMHYGEIEHRSIYGEATPVDARELIEEGIEVHPLPIIPDDRN
jgi:hypothetical protein